MPGRKMKTARAFIAIFLPAIFLLSVVGRVDDPSFENTS